MTVTTAWALPKLASPGSRGPAERTVVPVHPARRAARQRPGGRPVSYDRLAPSVRLSTAAHQAADHRGRRVLLGVLVGLLAVGSLLGVITLRSAGTVGVPTDTTVVQVHAGESLSEIAVRAAPGAPTEAVVQRIVALNGLSSASVRTGESLVVPRG